MIPTHVIVGAGSAGCVLAEGLSRDPRHHVLLLEAGPDYSGERSLPDDLLLGATPALASHDWGLCAEGPRGRTMPLPQGKVVGGCSQINSCIALRPDHGDFSPVNGVEHPAWGWDRMLACLRDIEHDLDFPDHDHHGATGPLTLRRPSPESLTPAARAFLDACVALGHPLVADHNAPHTTGVGIVAMNQTASGHRISANLAFLGPARSRSNLEIRARTMVERVIMEGTRVVGVSCRTASGLETIAAPRVILAAGAYATPAVLLRSGVGPHQDLEACGIPVRVDRPGVGHHLCDHPQLPILVASAEVSAWRSLPCVQVLVRYGSRAGPYANDMQLCLINHVELQLFEPQLAARWGASCAMAVTTNLMAAVSRGSVRLLPGRSGPRVVIQYPYDEDERDLVRHREGVRHVCALLEHPSFAPLVHHSSRPDERVLHDDTALDAWILENVQTGHHPMGTARMAEPSDPLGVVTPDLAVRGTTGLFVADASILAGPVRANTNLAVLAVARNAVGILSAEAGSTP
ncbi:GMC family oxidoreductase [Paraliomyxa miuraensis]|uniref:GMC family oxidoreductase n=1 Tax=Paraliomyxa miuraensis TaxID=376150 RepID=UPI002254B1E5|nr:GMC family oxidoreductase [Paraliomyxa miuraensis]MCX4245227.1 GMC family oxidoreductase [Paraliomyxa miuraensis]